MPQAMKYGNCFRVFHMGSPTRQPIQVNIKMTISSGCTLQNLKSTLALVTLPEVKTPSQNQSMGISSFQHNFNPLFKR